MANKRLSMRKAREILRLKHECGLSARKIGRSLGISAGTVLKYLGKAGEVGIGWPLPAAFETEELDALLGGSRSARREHPYPDMPYIHREVRRKGVTLQLLWEEYHQTCR